MVLGKNWSWASLVLVSTSGNGIATLLLHFVTIGTGKERKKYYQPDWDS